MSTGCRSDELDQRRVPLAQLVEVDPAVGEVHADAEAVGFERRPVGELLTPSARCARRDHMMSLASFTARRASFRNPTVQG